MDISQEKLFVMTTDNKDNIYLVMLVKVGAPDKDAKIQYNGTEHALFLRDSENIIILDFIPKQLHPVMKKAKSISVTETLSDFKTVIRRYEVPVQQSSAPYPKNILDSIQKPDDMQK